MTKDEISAFTIGILMLLVCGLSAFLYDQKDKAKPTHTVERLFIAVNEADQKSVKYMYNILLKDCQAFDWPLKPPARATCQDLALSLVIRMIIDDVVTTGEFPAHKKLPI